VIARGIVEDLTAALAELEAVAAALEVQLQTRSRAMMVVSSTWPDAPGEAGAAPEMLRVSDISGPALTSARSTLTLRSRPSGFASATCRESTYERLGARDG